MNLKKMINSLQKRDTRQHNLKEAKTGRTKTGRTNEN